MYKKPVWIKVSRTNNKNNNRQTIQSTVFRHQQRLLYANSLARLKLPLLHVVQLFDVVISVSFQIFDITKLCKPDLIFWTCKFFLSCYCFFCRRTN